jgi:hypothetical protein
MPDGSIMVEAFQTTYPSTVVSDVAILPGDTYMSHRVHGRFSFKIYYGKTKPSAAELDGTSDNMSMNPNTDSLDSPDAAGDRDDLDDITNTKRLTGPGAKAARSQAAARTDVGTLGRERRR